jgi:hypothetical protein
MLREPRTIAEVYEVARRFWGEPTSTLVKSNNFVMTLCALRNVPGKFLSDEERLAIRRIAVEVVRGVPA